MAHTIQRLTLYALISSLERDLRDFLSVQVAPLVQPRALLSDALTNKAKDRFAKENSEEVPNASDLLDYLDLGEEIQAIRAHDNELDPVTKSYIKKYYVGLEGLIPIRNRVMHSRPLEYDDFYLVSDLASELVKSHRALWANLRTTLRDLDRDPDFATTINIPDVADDDAKVLHNLPQVEFDDTGFVGREKELSELKRAILGSYPVVTVVGEGGLGKTALALKVCYDLLDDDEAKFDAIVWTTAKATKLTLSEILSIEGSISTSLGIIENATGLLGRQSETSAIDDLLTHLQNNKILLIIDNLETVIDNNIRNLVRQLPQGSKILFTTRIGLGAFDFPIPLSPLAQKESAFYFRRTAKVFGVSDLAMATTPIVDGFCSKLQNNPLFIKWFIQSVRAGKRPSVLISDPTILLQFCLQNVFNSLSAQAQAVASTLASVSGSQSVASIAFFTDLDSLSIQSALSVLITSNLISAERGRSSEDEDRYTLSPLARMYIQKFIRPNIDQQKKLIKKQNELRSAQDEYSARAGTDVVDMNNVFIRDKDDYIVARILTKAIGLIFKKEWPLAETEIERARDLSPNYFEVYRVRAFLHVEEQDYFSAEADYETAISLAEKRPSLRLWFAGFLSRKLGDQDRALEQLLEAEELAPGSALVKLEAARVLQYQRKFAEAALRLDAISDIDKLSSKTRRVHLDLSLQNQLRKSEDCSSKQDYKSALESLEAAKAILEAAPQSLIDPETTRHVFYAAKHFPTLERAYRGLSDERRLRDVLDWLSNSKMWGKSNDGTPTVTHVEPKLDREQASEFTPNQGKLTNMNSTFGFVETGSARFFFHRSYWSGQNGFRSAKEGMIVEFELGNNEKGVCAVNVRPITDAAMPKIEEEKSSASELGAINALLKTHGFIALDRGGSIFFHRSACTPATKWKSLAEGDRVRFRVGKSSSGRKCAELVELYSGV
jgi:cold shock CspA family protein/tetratricopeptide (TPR) repeat protein